MLCWARTEHCWASASPVHQAPVFYYAFTSSPSLNSGGAESSP